MAGKADTPELEHMSESDAIAQNSTKVISINKRSNELRVKVVKNKLAPPFRQVEFDLTFGVGISKVGEIIDMGVEKNIIKKSGSWFSYGETKLGQGREAVKQLLLDNEELMTELEDQIRQALKV